MTARQLALATLVAVPMALTAIGLAPEVLYPDPNVNDDAEHVLIAERASEALAAGENPLDPWVPQLELGYPQLSSYQLLPHIAVVTVHRLLLGLLPLRTVFDLVRYLLLVTFPLTVWWSMRTMGFSASASAVGAGASSLLAGEFHYGFEYDSYIWRGLGLFTQIFGMHLAFIALAALQRLLRDGRGTIATALASAGLVLAHLIYAYMLAIAAVVLILSGVSRATLRDRSAKLGAVAGLVGILTSFFVVPFFVPGRLPEHQPIPRPIEIRLVRSAHDPGMACDR